MLVDRIQSDLKEAQLQRDELKVATLRMLLSEIRYAEIAKGGQLNDQEAIVVLQREIKKRKEAASGFYQGNRQDAAQKEEAEAQILISYLPAQLSDEELTKIVEDIIKDMGAKSVTDMGKVIGAVMGKVAGKADGSRVSAIVKEKLR